MAKGKAAAGGLWSGPSYNTKGYVTKHEGRNQTVVLEPRMQRPQPPPEDQALYQQLMKRSRPTQQEQAADKQLIQRLRSWD